MRQLANIPITRKLTAVILLTSAGGLIAASLALFLFELATFRQTYLRDLDVLAQIIASQCTGSLAFDDRKDATEILSALTAKPNILSAMILKEGSGVFARYGSEDDDFGGMTEDGYRREGNHLLCVHPISLSSQRFGTLYLRTDYAQAFNESVRGHLGVLGLVLIGSILLILPLSTRLQRVISDPILRLAETAQMVAERKDYSARAPKLGRDELGLFTDAFNQMLAQIQAQDAALQRARNELEHRVQALQHEISERERAELQLELAHRELVEASRRAGMAEVATGVLHNVGNVLNSVNVSALLLQDVLRKSEVATVDKLAGLLRQHEGNLGSFFTQDKRGSQVPRLLTTLAEQLTSESRSMARELKLLATNIEHIKNIVALQQCYASSAGFIERVEIPNLVEDALQINVAALTRHNVQLVREFESVPSVFLDKHKFLQIMVNLIQNAKYALHEGNRPHKQLTLRIEKSAQTISVIVRDNGVGIPPENLTRIFSHGFTTRAKGHGFGLHASALAAREMGGELRAYSDGAGKGATLVLELPLLKKENRHELAS